ncbi:MAG TPA: alanine--glyoxylate aminotransferase family protein [Polyangiaceae bacterium]|jgi:alanine-glyoxylate transaminase/serine-glyoxylate transaminase/serine-pyruvate transaminase
MKNRPLLMIPGPIDVEQVVIDAMARPPKSHLAPSFVEAFSRLLGSLRQVFLAPDAQPFVVAGSGTLAMEMAVANVIEPGDRAVVVETGYFSGRMADILERHGARVTRVAGPLGAVPDFAEIESALASGPKVVTVTHVDTSTGVLAPVERIAAIAREHGALSIVDGVCSVGGESLRMGDWGVDVALTASQKALGAPPGLAIVLASPRAMSAWRARKTKVASYYADFGAWLPVLEAYEAKKNMYFATPPVQLVEALDASVASILADGVEARVQRHARIAGAFRAAWAALKLAMLPVSGEVAAHTLSAVYFPPGVDASLVARIGEEGAIVTGGLHPDAREKYFRVGHMGAIGPHETLAAIGAVERALHATGYHPAPLGAAVSEAQAALATAG